MAKTNNDNVKQAATPRSYRRANIAVIIVASIAALLIIAVAVLSGVKVDPARALARPDYYYFYDLDASSAQSTSGEAQSKISVATDDMKFSVMSAILEWKWDYTYNFKRTATKEKIEISASDIANTKATADEYMIEYVYAPVKIVGDAIDYSTAQSLECDGETVYFDRVKVLIGNSDGGVGTISIYPFIQARINNESDVEGIASDTYKITGINVRANTTKAYAALKDLAASLK